VPAVPQNHDELMHTRLNERDPVVGAVEAPSPFRSAFARARLEARSTGDLPPPTSARAETKPRVRGHAFEVRIEKRRGRRADEARWGTLGLKGWELVSVVDKHAFFRRRRRLI
jgi:hypothetical protein